ncbi:MAG: hypothetical protein LBK99_12540, partial [Opitutaceae bacterium]|nr:hypothetical protein [Opitutaceae bacterium]
RLRRPRQADSIGVSPVASGPRGLRKRSPYVRYRVTSVTIIPDRMAETWPSGLFFPSSPPPPPPSLLSSKRTQNHLT